MAGQPKSAVKRIGVHVRIGDEMLRRLARAT